MNALSYPHDPRNPRSSALLVGCAHRRPGGIRLDYSASRFFCPVLASGGDYLLRGTIRYPLVTGMKMQDQQLLGEYRRTRSQQAFAELVGRYADVVYAAARRQVKVPAMAEDVAQAVFLLMSQKAGRIGRGELLAGWLLRATWFTSRRTLTAERRREYHERGAAAMRTEATEPAWDTYSEEIDAAMAKLGAAERSAVTLRYFCGLSLREVGEQMLLSEDAARKRVDRGLEKLRTLLSKKVITPSAAGLAVAMAANGAEAAPASVLAIATGQASGSVVALAKGVGKMMAWAKLKAAVVLALVLGAGVVVAESRPHPAPATLPVVATTQPAAADAQTRALAAQLADQIELQMRKTARLSYSYRRENGLPTDADIALKRIGRPRPDAMTTAGEYAYDSATGGEYFLEVSDPDHPAKRYETEVGGTPGHWTTVHWQMPGAASPRWARVTPEQPMELGSGTGMRIGYRLLGTMTLPEALRKAQDIQINKEMLDGQECYRVALLLRLQETISVKSRRVTGTTIEIRRVWLCIDHALIPVRLEKFYIELDNSLPRSVDAWTLGPLLKSERLLSVLLQHDLRDMGNGIWLPTTLTGYTFGRGFVWGSQTRYTELAINDAVAIKTVTVPPEALKGVLKHMLSK